ASNSAIRGPGGSQRDRSTSTTAASSSGPRAMALRLIFQALASTVIPEKPLRGPVNILPIAKATRSQLDRGSPGDRLENDAITLGQLEELPPLLLPRVGIEVDREQDPGEPDRRLLAHAERAAKVEVPFGPERPAAHRHPERGRHRGER